MLSKPQIVGLEKVKTVFGGIVSWFNVKVVLENYGRIGGMYPTWKPFSIGGIKLFTGLYI